MTAVRFTPGLDGTIVAFNYDPAVVATIKQTVPAHARSWHPREKLWTIEAGWAPVLAATLRDYGHTVTGLDEPPPRHRDHDWAKMLFRRVGPARAGPVFRSLSKILHPDAASGDAQLQRELNAAHQEISSRPRP